MPNLWRDCRFFVLSLFVFMFLSSTTNARKAGEKPIRLACYYFDRESPYQESNSFSPGLPSVWAKGKYLEDIYLSGENRGGFFVVNAVKGVRSGIFNSQYIATYDNSDDFANRACIRGLQYAFPDKYHDKELIHVGGKHSFLSIHATPVVFKNHADGQLKKIDRMVIFGDSLSDQGNLKNWLRMFPRAPYFAGRFTNLKNWVDYMQQQSNIAVQNWAVGGSVTDIFLDPELQNKPFMERLRTKLKVRASGSMRRELKRYRHYSLGEEAIPDVDRTFFTIWIGGNDYINFWDDSSDLTTFIDDPTNKRIGSDIVINRAISNSIYAIKELYALGARNFMVGNLPNIGVSPRILQAQYRSGGGLTYEQQIFTLSYKMTEVIKAHNLLLEEALRTVEADFPDIHIGRIDAAQGMAVILGGRRFDAPEQSFDFDLDTSNQIDFEIEGQSLAIDEACFMGSALWGSGPDDVCEEPNRRLFWDDVHPTTYGHCLIASQIHHNASQKEFLNAVTLDNYLSLCRPELAFE